MDERRGDQTAAQLPRPPHRFQDGRQRRTVLRREHGRCRRPHVGKVVRRQQRQIGGHAVAPQLGQRHAITANTELD